MTFTEFIWRNWREILALTGEHFRLVAVSMLIVIAIGIPTGVVLTRVRFLKRPTLAVAGILQTVPSLALFGLLIPVKFIGGIGARTAIVALTLYALLPVVRNTVTGIEGVARSVREAARAMGMTDWQILWQVELPLASSVILAGVRVATVITIGVATIAAAIGAGGLGTYIFRGLRSADDNLILAGAIPAALLALAADAGFGLLEKFTNERLGLSERKRTREEMRQQKMRRRIFLSTAGALCTLAAGFFIVRSIQNDKRFASSNTDARSSNANLSSNAFTIGSKDFTESVILAEILAQELETRGVRVERQFELGGNLAHDSLVAGKIDSYPEYTGTSFTAILKHQPITDPRAVYEQVKREYEEKFNVEASAPLGFANDFAILLRGEDARKYNLQNISDIIPFARNWRAGFGQDFISRPDGYAGFVKAYNLQFAAPPREMDLSLTYRALAAKQVDVIAGNSTDGLISALDLFQLRDDRRYFPPYEAVFLTRRDALTRTTQAREALQKLAGAITTDEMRRMNFEVDGRKRAVADVAREWRKTVIGDK